MDVGDLTQGLIAAAAGLLGAWWGARITRKAMRETAAHDERQRRRADLIEVRAAARLLTEQLRAAKILISRSLEDKQWINPGSSAFDRVVWESTRTVLAKLLDEPEWTNVLGGVDSAIGFGRLAADFEGPLVDPSQEMILTGLLSDVTGAIDSLRFHRAAGDLIQSSIGSGVRSNA